MVCPKGKYQDILRMTMGTYGSGDMPVTPCSRLEIWSPSLFPSLSWVLIPHSPWRFKPHEYPLIYAKKFKNSKKRKIMGNDICTCSWDTLRRVTNFFFFSYQLFELKLPTYSMELPTSCSITL